MKIGITGGIASGKSLVSHIIREHGYTVLDADRIAREIVEPGRQAYLEIAHHFGLGILDDVGDIDREKLGQIIFRDAGQREVLNKITHPIIRNTMLQQAEEIENSEGIVFLDIPLLFETKYEKLVDVVIVVFVPFDIQVQRLMDRSEIPEDYAKQKISTQMPLDLKSQMADFVIDNSGTIHNTKLQVEDLLQGIKEK
ncbi:dephospho-CoA kinase [Desulfuribacillus stibiiarsenatis]|uniref:Dephospho-CoA kinase n=1 Tax=Desulfuribacillus stibiiarsenatis TaxID=1390249 RepID=A0A1E5L2T5_9FIRM|nr:dephospho-CoA kinase [Desulfuribacillus stibiiarsenatis]OEH84450.1 dephospho-CoA kinase [Desulfuribacillus stibiiarsenatis]